MLPNPDDACSFAVQNRPEKNGEAAQIAVRPQAAPSKPKQLIASVR